QFQRWTSLRQRDGTSGHEGNLHRAGCVVHFFCPVPTIREMLVAENGRHFAALSKHRDDFVKKAFPRVFLLASPVDGIAAMLANGEYRINCELVAALAKRLGNGFVDWN